METLSRFERNAVAARLIAPALQAAGITIQGSDYQIPSLKQRAAETLYSLHLSGPDVPKTSRVDPWRKWWADNQARYGYKPLKPAAAEPVASPVSKTEPLIEVAAVNETPKEILANQHPNYLLVSIGVFALLAGWLLWRSRPHRF